MVDPTGLTAQGLLYLFKFTHDFLPARQTFDKLGCPIGLRSKPALERPV